jgi:hypothetical protein
MRAASMFPDAELEKVKQAACALPYVEVRRSTGGGGIHLYCYLDDAGVPTANHTEHAALARCILGMMSAECGFDFASQIDACGHVMWIWHRKMTAENHGLEIIKPVTQVLSEADLPANWRDHIDVVTRKRSKVRITRSPAMTVKRRTPTRPWPPAGRSFPWMTATTSRSRPCNACTTRRCGSTTTTCSRRTPAPSRSCAAARRRRNSA